YRNCGLLEPFVLAVGVVGSLITDDLPNPLELRRAFWTRYGSLRFRCNAMLCSEFVRVCQLQSGFSLCIAEVLNRYCKVTAIAASANMLITSAVMVAHKRSSA
ncbi:hypothetical protein OSTOST_23472, partial [Ostertagia ostertagi]